MSHAHGGSAERLEDFDVSLCKSRMFLFTSISLSASVLNSVLTSLNASLSGLRFYWEMTCVYLTTGIHNGC